MTDSEVGELRRRLDELERRSGLTSPNVLTRAFTVWGYALLAQVVLVAGIAALAAVFTFLAAFLQ